VLSRHYDVYRKDNYRASVLPRRRPGV
jgi:hypothetical protein